LYRINGYQALLLQGFSREFVKKAKKAETNPRKLLMQAGNAMTVTVIEAICGSLLRSISADKT
jgi:DNA (cytosine-5)-methyltransferase 1